MAFRLPRLPDDIELVEPTRRASFKFQRWWQSVMKAIETQETAQDELLEAIIAAQAAADAANEAAAAAQTAADAADTAAGGAQVAADNAQAAADQAAADSSLASSGTIGLTMTATDAGASATITASAHTRAYGDGTSVAVSGGAVTGLLYSTTYYVYYLDPTRAGGAVTYLASTDPADAVQSGSVHSVGAVGTPAAAGPPEDGTPWNAPGLPYI
jgi:hypothetical protein